MHAFQHYAHTTLMHRASHTAEAISGQPAENPCRVASEAALHSQPHEGSLQSACPCRCCGDLHAMSSMAGCTACTACDGQCDHAHMCCLASCACTHTGPPRSSFTLRQGSVHACLHMQARASVICQLSCHSFDCQFSCPFDLIVSTFRRPSLLGPAQRCLPPSQLSRRRSCALQTPLQMAAQTRLHKM